MALTKIINDENKEYRPVLTDKLVLDAKPTVNSFNAITSDAVARAVAGASGEVPQVTEDDNGKVLGAIYDAGGPAVDWVDQPVSNVTTSDKQFVVGVNGTGLPITVDCSGATEVIDSSTFTENGTALMYQGSYPAVKFAMANLPNNNLGSGTATLTIPEDFTYDSAAIYISPSPTAGYLDGTSNMRTCTLIPSGMVSSGKFNAGTYTISDYNGDPSVYDDGIGIFFNGGGNPQEWADFLAAFDEAVQSWTISYSGEALLGYNFAPATFPSLTGNANKVLKANAGETGVEWANENVTTTMGSFTVGVNGSGVPLTVNCTNGTISEQSTSFNYSAGGSTFSETWFAALKFDLGEGVTVDGNAWGNPLFVVPTTVSVTLPTGSSLVEGNSGLLFAQVYEYGGQTVISNRGNPYSWASTSPITVTTVGDVSTVTLTAGSYEFVKAWNPNPSYDTLLFFLPFTGTLTSEVKTELENALRGCTVKNNQYGGGFATITGYSIKPAELPTVNEYQANKFLQVSSNGAYTQWSHVFPTYDTTTDAGKVLAVGSSGLRWINSVPIEVVASLPASPTDGVLYIVTGA